MTYIPKLPKTYENQVYTDGNHVKSVEINMNTAESHVTISENDVKRA